MRCKRCSGSITTPRSRKFGFCTRCRKAIVLHRRRRQAKAGVAVDGIVEVAEHAAGASLPPAVEKELVRVLETQHQRLGVFTAARAAQQARRLTKLDGFWDKIEGALFSNPHWNLNTQDADTIIRAGQLIQKEKAATQDLVERALEQNPARDWVAAVKRESEIPEDARAKIEELPPESREKVRRVLEKIGAARLLEAGNPYESGNGQDPGE